MSHTGWNNNYRTPKEGKFAGALAHLLFWGGLIYIIVKAITFDW